MKLNIFILLVLVWFLPRTVSAQYSSNNNKFTVKDRKGCAPFSFKVTHPSCPTGVSCTVVFGDGRPNQNFNDGDIIAPYTTPGTIVMQIIASNSADNDEITIDVQPAAAPTFEVYACQSGAVQVKITDSQYPLYTIN